MVVLVTGGSGFVGRHVLTCLAQSGNEIHATFNTARRSLTKGVVWHQTDLLNAESRWNLLARVRPSHLIHLAWYVTPNKYWTAQENACWLRASLELLTEFSRLGGRRAVITGTCAEYSWSSGGFLREDETPMAPSSLYGACKQALSSVALHLAKELGISIGCGRIFFPYGPGEQPERLVPSVVLSLLRGQPALCTLGRQIRDYIYVADVAAALTVLLKSEFTGSVNIGTGTGLLVADMVLLIGNALGRPDLIRLGALPTRSGEPDVLIADTERLIAIGFVPRYTPERGIQETIDSWKHQVG